MFFIVIFAVSDVAVLLFSIFFFFSIFDLAVLLFLYWVYFSFTLFRGFFFSFFLSFI